MAGLVSGPARYWSETWAMTPAASFASNRRRAWASAAWSSATTRGGAGAPGPAG